MPSLNHLDSLVQDLRYGLRSLWKSPGFTIAAVLTLAIGIGGNTAMFSVIHGVLLQPLDYPEPDSLVYFAKANPNDPAQDLPFSIQRLDHTRDGNRSFSGIGAFLARTEDFILAGAGDPEVLKGARISANFLDILGVSPVLGRGFLPEEDSDGGPPVAMISAGLWKRRFGGDTALAGKSAVLNATPHTIVGVVPAGFSFPFPEIDVWVTHPSQYSALDPRFWTCCSPLLGFARLRPGIALDEARSELSLLDERYAAAYPGGRDSGPLRLTLLKDHLTADVETMLWMLFGVVAFVLLIACANIASLVMARATARLRELAMRTALGASPGRLLRQLLTESLVLAAAGGIAGLLLARFALDVITRITAFDLPVQMKSRSTA